jgi:hypothetical protein
MSFASLFGGAARVIGSRAGSAATGAAIGAGLASRGGRRRRRARKRLTSSEISELMQLQTIFGKRSPVVTLAGMKMLNRGP